MAQRLPGFCGMGIAVDKQFSFKTNKLFYLQRGKKRDYSRKRESRETNKQTKNQSKLEKN